MTKTNLITKTNNIQKKIDNNTISSIDMTIADKIDSALAIGSIQGEKHWKETYTISDSP